MTWPPYSAAAAGRAQVHFVIARRSPWRPKRKRFTREYAYAGFLSSGQPPKIRLRASYRSRHSPCRSTELNGTRERQRNRSRRAVDRRHSPMRSKKRVPLGHLHESGLMTGPCRNSSRFPRKLPRGSKYILKPGAPRFLKARVQIRKCTSTRRPSRPDSHAVGRREPNRTRPRRSRIASALDL